MTTPFSGLPQKQSQSRRTTRARTGFYTAGAAASYKGRNEYIDRLCRFPLLILDDFGMERGTEYGLEQVYNVVDSRTAAPLDAKPDLVKRIGNTTFDIHIHFSETSRETFTDKVVRLIENDKDSVTD